MAIQNKVPEKSVIATLSLEPEFALLLASTVRALLVTYKMIRESPVSDSVLEKLRFFHHTKWPEACTDKKISALIFVVRSRWMSSHLRNA